MNHTTSSTAAFKWVAMVTLLRLSPLSFQRRYSNLINPNISIRRRRLSLRDRGTLLATLHDRGDATPGDVEQPRYLT